MNDKLPDFLQNVIEEYPEVWKAYQALGEACGTAGPLEPKTARLIKLALAIGAKSEGAVHSHTRRAPPRRYHARRITTSRTARRNLYRLVLKHGRPVLDSRCAGQTVVVFSGKSAWKLKSLIPLVGEVS